MVITSETVSITVMKRVYALSIGVYPDSGVMGDVFTFVGILSYDGMPAQGVIAQLVDDRGLVVGEDATGANGDYEIKWTASRTGTIGFYATAPGFSVSSEMIYITVSQYALSIGVTPSSGYLGDEFRFVGILTVDGFPVQGVTVQLVDVGLDKVVGEAVTKANGNYDIYWTATRTGVLYFYAAAPGLGITSDAISAEISEEEVEEVSKLPIIAGLGTIALVVVASAARRR